MSTTPPDRLPQVFVDIADTLVDEFDLIEFLEMVTGHVADLAGGSAGGLLLADHHQVLHLMAATDERAHMLELFQVQRVEGPCQDCFSSGQVVSHSDLRQAADRWPQFAPRAVAAGYRSVHAVPMRLRDEVIGALNLFSTEVDGFAATDPRVVRALTDVATIGLLQERAVRQAEVLTEQLQGALTSRIVIEQAKGALAHALGTTPDSAFDTLRSYSRRNHLRLSDVARAVLNDPSDLPDLRGPDVNPADA
ncbi:MAG: hypothetical protein QOK15_399 [Nocardioidaceae bacterium]|jgi:transcriptional regulator with GAF, ATPase, and Fis domain|nr:hypothetical protein [Nocardioidaceae bacterium]